MSDLSLILRRNIVVVGCLGAAASALGGVVFQAGVQTAHGPASSAPEPRVVESEPARVDSSDYGSLTELSSEDLIDQVLSEGTSHGYVFPCEAPSWGTTVSWRRDPEEARQEAQETGRPLFVMNVSGEFTDRGKT